MHNEAVKIKIPGNGGDIALDELPALVIGSVVLKEPAAMLEPV